MLRTIPNVCWTANIQIQITNILFINVSSLHKVINIRSGVNEQFVYLTGPIDLAIEREDRHAGMQLLQSLSNSCDIFCATKDQFRFRQMHHVCHFN